MSTLRYQAVAYVAPSLIADGNCSRQRFGPVFARSAGSMIGALCFGYLADRMAASVSALCV